MRRLVLTIASIIALTACTSDGLLKEMKKDTTVPQVITFSSYSEKATKGTDNGNTAKNTNLEYYHSTFAVHATKKDIENEIQYVFGDTATMLGTICYYTGNNTPTFYGTNWRYDEERFWDKYAYYNFIAYAPALPDTSLLVFRYGQNDEVGDLGVNGRDVIVPDYIMNGTNLHQAMPQTYLYEEFDDTTAGHDIDLMISQPITNLRGTYNSTVQFDFHHIFSKLNISIAKTIGMNEGMVIIDSLIITGLRDKGTYVESTYNDDPQAYNNGWTLATNNNPNFELAYRRYNDSSNSRELPDQLEGQDPTPLYFIESLLLPQNISNNAKLSLRYHITKNNGTYSEIFKYDIDFNKIFANILGRSYYTIKFRLESEAITFDADAATWAEKEEQTVSVLPDPLNP